MEAWILTLAGSAFWAGILLEGVGRRGSPAWVAAAFLGMGLALLLAGLIGASSSSGGRGRPALHWGRSLLAFGLLGAGWSGLHEAGVRASPIARMAGRSAVLEGALSTDPLRSGLGWSASLSVAFLAVSVPGVAPPIPARAEVWIEGRGAAPPLQAGDRIRATGTLAPLKGPFGEYLRHRGYAATFSTGHVISRGPPGNPLMRAADIVRGALHSSVSRVLPSREGGLLLGLALGDTSRLDPAVEESFRATGLSHLTAVSGENLAMFLAPVLGLAIWLGLGRRARFLLGMVSVCFFVLLTRAEPSVLRAAFMSGLAMLGLFLGRPRSPPAILGGAVLLLLAINPTLVYAIGFQLSVAATAGIAAIAAPLAGRLGGLPRGLALAAATTIAAQAGVTPLLLYHFGVVPTVSIPANLLAFPAVGPGMLLGLIGAGVGILARPLGMALGWAARLPLGYLEEVAARLARFPLPSITSGGGRLAMLALESAVVAVGARWVRSGARISRRGVVALAVVVPVMAWSTAIRAGPPGSLTMTFFAVGWGDSALVRSPGGATILIDGGPDRDLIAAKLGSLGIKRIDLMVATHPHADHVVGLPAVLARFPVGLVIDPGCPGSSPFYGDFLHAVTASGVEFGHPRRGDSLRVGDVWVRVLGPEHCWTGTHSDPNNDSLVLLLTSGGATVLFGGDAEVSNQTDLLRDEADRLPAPLVKWPHHGGNTNLDGFFDAVHARVAVVSVGPNLYGDPSPAVLAKLVEGGTRVYRTDQAGDVTAMFEGGKLLIQSKND
jgi:competence protein ComEC